MGGLVGLWGNRGKMNEVLESEVVPTVLYGSESWGGGLNARERRKLKCLRKVPGVGVTHMIRKRDVRKRCGNKASLLERGDQSTLMGFGHMVGMDKVRLTKRISKSDVEALEEGVDREGGGKRGLESLWGGRVWVSRSGRENRGRGGPEI